MINKQLVSPRHIAVIGASDNHSKPGGKVLHNLVSGGFAGKIYAVNPKPVTHRGAVYCRSIDELPETDLAIIAIPAAECVEVVERLCETKNTRAFIIFSAGFGEAGPKGKELEAQLVEVVDKYKASLIGPNCIGIINAEYKGVFTTPIPEYFSKGCELISGSGATAVFIMEAAIKTGIRFSNVYTVGNSAQTGVEDILEYLDETFDLAHSAPIKLLYLEHISNAEKFLKHASSLINKGCRIAAIKSGSSEAGSRAASSHTGAMATADSMIRAIFKKAGIVYCSGREELITVACIFQSRPLKGKNIAVISHAGGSAVMLTDALTNGGMQVPQTDGLDTSGLLAQLHPGSSVSNPFDFLATGTAYHLGLIIDFCEQSDLFDGMVVVFGSPGLFNVEEAYRVLEQKIKVSKKPIYPVLPSLINAQEEINDFMRRGFVNFPDEVVLGNALAIVAQCEPPAYFQSFESTLPNQAIKTIFDGAVSGYLSPNQCVEILSLTGVEMAKERVCNTKDEVMNAAIEIGFPLVMKVVGPVHKTDVGGVTLNINSLAVVELEFERMMGIADAKSVLLQPMVEGIELIVGAVKHGHFGHMMICGLGGVFVEVLHDIAYGVAPLNKSEALQMIQSLNAYKIIKGYRNYAGVDENLLADVLVNVSQLVTEFPAIEELDINPLKGKNNKLIAVDARIRLG